MAHSDLALAAGGGGEGIVSGGGGGAAGGGGSSVDPKWLEDPSFVRDLLGSLPGVDVRDVRVQAVIQAISGGVAGGSRALPAAEIAAAEAEELEAEAALMRAAAEFVAAYEAVAAAEELMQAELAAPSASDLAAAARAYGREQARAGAGPPPAEAVGGEEAVEAYRLECARLEIERNLAELRAHRRDDAAGAAVCINNSSSDSGSTEPPGPKMKRRRRRCRI